MKARLAFDRRLKGSMFSRDEQANKQATITSQAFFFLSFSLRILNAPPPLTAHQGCSQSSRNIYNKISFDLLPPRVAGFLYALHKVYNNSLLVCDSQIKCSARRSGLDPLDGSVGSSKGAGPASLPVCMHTLLPSAKH